VNFNLKRYLAITLTLLAVAQPAPAAPETHFHAGVAAYEAGDYAVAARAFSDSLAVQPAAGTLLNLGLAEWRRGRTGEAILAWEQSAWLDPFNSAARKNLIYARENVPVSPPDLTWFEQTSTWLPAGFWAWITGGTLSLAVALVTVPAFLRKRKAGWHQTIAALAFGIFIVSLAPAVGIVTRSNLGIVTEKNTSLRLTPTLAAEPVAALSPGEPVRELRRRGNYLFVHTQIGNGWVERRQIGFVIPRPE